MNRPSSRRKPVSQVSLVVSLVFHAGVIAALGFFAAREGFFGQQLKTIAVTLAPKEKPPEPEKPKEPEKLPEPTPEPPRETVAATPPPAPLTPPPAPAAAPTTANLAPPAAAPPPAALPAFSFSDGAKAVDSTSDPVTLYKSFVEYSLRARWTRPDGVEDNSFVAEVELAIDPAGRITGSTWKRGSGHAAWDASVREALGRTPSLGRTPPKGFPGSFLVRFDVAAEVDALNSTPSLP